MNSQKYLVKYDTSKEGSSTQTHSLPHHLTSLCLNSSLVLGSHVIGSLCRLHAIYTQWAEFKAGSWCTKLMKTVVDK